MCSQIASILLEQCFSFHSPPSCIQAECGHTPHRLDDTVMHLPIIQVLEECGTSFGCVSRSVVPRFLHVSFFVRKSSRMTQLGLGCNASSQ